MRAIAFRHDISGFPKREMAERPVSPALGELSAEVNAGRKGKRKSKNNLSFGSVAGSK